MKSSPRPLAGSSWRNLKDRTEAVQTRRLPVTETTHEGDKLLALCIVILARVLNADDLERKTPCLSDEFPLKIGCPHKTKQSKI